MKLDSYHIAQLVNSGAYSEACDALLAHFHREPLSPDAHLRVNRTAATEEGCHIIIYVMGHWYEWGSKTGFRSGDFLTYAHHLSGRVVIWLPRENA